MEISDPELIGRYYKVFAQYVETAPKLADCLEEYGRIRKELMLLLQEIKERKLEVPDAPDDTRRTSP